MQLQIFCVSDWPRHGVPPVWEISGCSQRIPAHPPLQAGDEGSFPQRRASPLGMIRRWTGGRSKASSPRISIHISALQHQPAAVPPGTPTVPTNTKMELHSSILFHQQLTDHKKKGFFYTKVILHCQSDILDIRVPPQQRNVVFYCCFYDWNNDSVIFFSRF